MPLSSGDEKSWKDVGGGGGGGSVTVCRKYYKASKTESGKQKNKSLYTTLNSRIGQSKPAGLQNPLSSSSLVRKEKKKEKEKTKDRQAYFNFTLFPFSFGVCWKCSGVSNGQCCLSWRVC